MHPTAERLMTEALRLFSTQGYRATTVGEIEAAAGLVPRRGALYRHFRSKRALLEAAVERHVAQMQTVIDAAGEVEAGDLRDRLLELAELLLTFMELTRELTHVIEREGNALPRLRDRFRDEVVDAGFRYASAFVAERLESLSSREHDALGVAIMGSVVAYRRAEWTFGKPSLGLPRDRFLKTWAEGAAAAIEAADHGRRQALER